MSKDISDFYSISSENRKSLIIIEEVNVSYRKIRISILSMKKIENKNLMFRSYIDNNENQSLLDDNESEDEFLNESFALFTSTSRTTTTGTAVEVSMMTKPHEDASSLS